MDEDNKISITICGDGGCGKSSITLRLVKSQWMNEYDPTIEDSYSVTRTIDGRQYSLSLTDTAGQEEYRGLWTAATLKADAFLLVYDITNPESVTALDHFAALIEMESEQRAERGAVQPVKIVAGNKCDLSEQRRVKAQTGLEWARSNGCGFMETSAREMVNVEETFALIVRRVIEARREAISGTPSSPGTLSGSLPSKQSQPQPMPQMYSSQNSTYNEKQAVTGQTEGPASSNDSRPREQQGILGFLKSLKCW